MMISEFRPDQEWITLRDASRATGRSMTALRVMIKRGKDVMAKKVAENNREYWLLHKDTVQKLTNLDSEQLNDPVMIGDHNDPGSSSHGDPQVATIAEFFERQRKELMEERDQALQGLMMYRYKFEEMERKMRLLPAPPELISEDIKKRNEITEQARRDLAQAQKELEDERTSKQESLARAIKLIMDKEHILREKEQIAAELEKKLHEEAHAKEAYRIEMERAIEESRRPWWKKMLRIK